MSKHYEGKQEMYERIDEWLEAHKEDMIRDIKRIVRIPSVSRGDTEEGPFGKNCKKVLQEMLQLGREHGFFTENYENYVGSIGLEKKDFKNTIGFWNHLDVVPVGSNWQYDPFEATYLEPFLIGRGVGDNKSPAIGIVYLMKCLRELEIPMNHELCLFVGCDEEKGMSDVEYYVANYETPAFSIVPDCGFPVCYGEKGILEGEMVTKGEVSSHVKAFKGGLASNMIPDRASVILTGDGEYLKKLEEELKLLSEKDAQLTESKEKDAKENFADNTNNETEKPKTYFEYQVREEEIEITYCGISKHSAAPMGSSNAINGLCHVLYELEQFEEADKSLLSGIEKLSGEYMGEVPGIAYRDDISGDTTCAATIIELRDGKLCLTLNIRYAITADNEKDMASLTAFAEENGMEWRNVRNSKPNYFPKENPLVDLLTGVFNEATGENRESYVMGGGTYARKLPNAVAYGLGGVKEKEEETVLRSQYILPGHGGAHEPDEVLNINTYMAGLKIFARAILAMNEVSL